MRQVVPLVVVFAMIALGCAAREGRQDSDGPASGAAAPRPGPHVISVGQRWSDAEGAARVAGYRLNDARELAWASPGPNGKVGIDGFYVLLPGDTQLIVSRDPEKNVVGRLHLEGNVSQPKAYRTHRDPGRSFELPVPDRVGRGMEGG